MSEVASIYLILGIIWKAWIDFDVFLNEKLGGDKGETISQRLRESHHWFPTLVLRHFGDPRPTPDLSDGEACDEPDHVNIC